MRLDFFRKPVVEFDPSNRQHRRDYAQFLKTGSWRHCRVRYELIGIGGELQGMMQRRLLEFYTDREFKNPTT
jgi:hypothetical protein